MKFEATTAEKKSVPFLQSRGEDIVQFPDQQGRLVFLAQNANFTWLIVDDGAHVSPKKPCNRRGDNRERSV
ncbi:MAG: hypothetical protein U0744_21620, partial [Gemmataceae bacterium]